MIFGSMFTDVYMYTSEHYRYYTTQVLNHASYGFVENHCLSHITKSVTYSIDIYVSYYQVCDLQHRYLCLQLV